MKKKRKHFLIYCRIDVEFPYLSTSSPGEKSATSSNGPELVKLRTELMQIKFSFFPWMILFARPMINERTFS